VGLVDRKITQKCKKCNKETIHRLVNDKRKSKSYYSCSLCLERNCRTYRKKHWPKYLAQKANTRKRKDSIIITKEHIENLYEKQKGICAISGKNFDIESKWLRPSLDRIDSDKGYQLDNIQLVTWIVNHTKGNLSDDEFIQMCYDITYYQDCLTEVAMNEAQRKLGW
jgi:hypothetical protein